VNTTVSPATAYVDAVRTALADLPADDLAEIVDDVRDHIEQVTTELGEDASLEALNQRLGTPADYANELRSAAGYPPGPDTVGESRRSSRVRRGLTTWLIRIAVVLTMIALLEAFSTDSYAGGLFLAVVAWLVAGVVALFWLVVDRSSGASLADLPDVHRLDGLTRWLRRHSVGAAVVETIVALRPAWWIARAWIAVELIGLFFVAEWFPLPTFPGALLLFAVAVVISVWLGRRAAGHRQTSAEHVLVLLGNVVAVLAVAALFGRLAGGGIVVLQEEVAPGDVVYFPPGAYSEDGKEITNLYPYGSDGRLLENVGLYDQDGRPFTSLTYNGCMVDEMTGEPDLPALNVFPRPSSIYVEDPVGAECRDRGIIPPFGSTLPGTPSEPTPTTSPTASPPAPTSTPGS
jgi:uncharacterized membrane protein